VTNEKRKEKGGKRNGREVGDEGKRKRKRVEGEEKEKKVRRGTANIQSSDGVIPHHRLHKQSDAFGSIVSYEEEEEEWKREN